jgi:hypothetical protein
MDFARDVLYSKHSIQTNVNSFIFTLFFAREPGLLLWVHNKIWKKFRMKYELQDKKAQGRLNPGK